MITTIAITVNNDTWNNSFLDMLRTATWSASLGTFVRGSCIVFGHPIQTGADRFCTK